MSDDQETAVFPSLAADSDQTAKAAEVEAAKVAAEAARAKAEARLCFLPSRPAVM